jgi:hypothetical protein
MKKVINFTQDNENLAGEFEQLNKQKVLLHKHKSNLSKLLLKSAVTGKNDKLI